MNYLALVSLIGFLVYNSYIYTKYGMLKSISISYDSLQKEGKGLLFDLFGFVVGIPFWFYGRYVVNIDAITCYALAGFFMIGLTMASLFSSDRVIGLIHYICTGCAIIFSIIGIYYQYNTSPFWLIPIGSVILTILLVNSKPLIWIEYFIFTVIISRLLIL